MSERIPAAVVRAYGEPPEFSSFDAPPAPSEGQLLVEVEVAGLNPVDVAFAERTYFLPSPPLPYVPGIEAVGRVSESAAPGIARVANVPWGIAGRSTYTRAPRAMPGAADSLTRPTASIPGT